MQAELAQANLDAFYALSPNGPEILESVYEREVDHCLDMLTLVFSKKILTCSVNIDDDTLSIRLRDRSIVKSRTAKLSRRLSDLIGQRFGWGWVTVNQQGYCDGAILSFDGLDPNIHIQVAASSIDIYEVKLLTREQRRIG